jgi:L-ascorbate metabolism protein UlaG (beta-lactamase superfamily)
MRIKWLGLASFLITTDNGTKIVTDPYQTGGELAYGEIRESADIVTVSHDHFDHNNVSAIQGKPEVLKKPGQFEVKGIGFQGIASLHDDVGGRARGKNNIFCFDVDGMRICHLGDLGHELRDEHISGIGSVDILLIPVGGVYTIDAKMATMVCEQLKPKIVIPMHYRDGKCNFPIATVDDFLREKENVRRLDSSDMEIRKKELQTATEIVVMKSAL